MANDVLLTPQIIAKEALMQLDNHLVMAGLVYRDYQDEFVKVGDTISIRRPVRYTVTDGPTLALQDTLEGKTQITINKQKHVDMVFTSKDLTLTIFDFSERYIKPAMIQLANQVDLDVMSLYQNVWNWVGTPGDRVNTIPAYMSGAQRLDEMAVSAGMRNGVLCPNDYYGLAGNFTTLLQDEVVKTALQEAKLGKVAGTDTYMAQNIPTLLTAARGGTPVIDGDNQDVTYAQSLNTNTWSLNTRGWTASTLVLNAGEVITLAGVFAVNPVSKNPLPYLQQFVVQSPVTSDGGGLATIVLGPACILSGAYQTATGAPVDGASIVPKGSANSSYQNNLVFHKNAFALCTVPMDLPEGAAYKAREKYKNLSVRVVGFYDGVNDRSAWRFDIMYGVKAIYPDLATRLSGA